ncbi:MAG: hypothetical protein SFV81_10430, partial [Pirellulaceae bacterium]|nr:hypothetical protein [Pirellulaceae bacterium]
SEQALGEKSLLVALEDVLGIRFDTGSTELPIDGVKPDAISLSNRIVVEVYARIGSVKGAQQHKIKGDILKLAFIGQRLGTEWRKILCFASKEAASYASGATWVAEAAREFGIEIVAVDIPEDIKASIVTAQVRQRMINAGVET